MPAIPSQRILVVDDEPTVCETIRMLLALDGHRVQTAHDGNEGLARFESSSFDLVITDYCMPYMKGDEFAEALKQRFPSLPVLLLTAFPPAQKPDSIDLVLTKPFCFQSLRDALATLVNSISFPQAKSA